VKSVRRAGVNSGSKRLAECGPRPANSYTKRRGTPVVTASPCPHAPQIEGAYETIYPAPLSTSIAMTMSPLPHRKTDRLTVSD
jgi:hypothetical protein